MQIRVSDYIANFFADHGIHTVFTVVGGGAMFLNDSFGHHQALHCIYNHHEQASAMAAEAYFRINNEMAAVCVTGGPGGINALNGVAGAYQDSIPMIVISGQVKSTLTVRACGLKLRTLGGQEADIVSMVSGITKYAEMIMRAEDIRYCLEKALYTALNKRPGPCWLDIPVDIQGTLIETDSLKPFVPLEEEKPGSEREKESESKIQILLEHLKSSKRPVLYAGNGIRIAGAVSDLSLLTDMIHIPVVTCWDSIDLIETKHPLYCGRGGTMGDRAGNFAVQNSDFLLCIGTRLTVYQVGYNVNTWAREAFVTLVDIDSEELKKPTIHVDLPICEDAGIFLKLLCAEVKKNDFTVPEDWTDQCNLWKKKYPVVTERHYQDTDKVNVYAFIDTLSRKLPDYSVTVVGNGSASVVGSQSYWIGKGQRFIMNCAISSMGYDLPATIGAVLAADNRTVICITGDGSIQMNIQELQTIVTNHLPVKIFVINNQGYHQIRLTQKNLFHNGYVGVGPESGDLGFPDFEKIAWAYGISYVRINNNTELSDGIEKTLQSEHCCLCEVMCSTDQIFEPKSASRRLESGEIVSPPLEDLAPFLSKQELAENMYIPLL